MSDPEFLRDSLDGETPSITEVIELAIRQQQAQTYTCIPARVVSYDAATQTAEVQPVVQVVGSDSTPRKIPPIKGVPVIFPVGSGGTWALTFDIAAGDTGLLHVASVSVGPWRATGSEDTKPDSARRSNLADSFFSPGARPKAQALAAPSGLSLGHPSSGKRIHISNAGVITVDGSEIKLGSGATDFVALASLIDAYFTALKTSLDLHTHTSAAPGSPTTPPILPSPTPPATVGATKTKAE